MKNNLINKNIITALLIGISASMTIAEPIKVFANEGEGDNNNNNDTTQQTPTEAPSVVDDASAQAQETQEAVETAVETVAAVQEEVVTGESAMTSGEAGAVANEAIEEAITQTEEAYDTEKLEEAGEKVEAASKDLEEAKTADVTAQEEAKEVVDTTEAADQLTQDAEATVEEAQIDVDELTKQLNEASSVEEANEIYDKLATVVEQTEEDIETKKAILDKLNADFNDAIANLKAAEQDFEDNVEEASENAQEAQEIIDDVATQVKEAETAVAEAAAKVEVEKEAADTITTKMSETKNNWTSQAELLKTIIKYYYIPQVVGDTEVAPEDIKITRVGGFDTQECNYYMAVYKDADGNTQTYYFNYDRTDRKKKNNRYGDLGSSKDIIFFEKTVEEIGADTYLKQYYADEDFYKRGVVKGESEYRSIMMSMANAGRFAVYAYYVDGKVHYMVQEEIENGIANGTVVNDNGTYVVNGIEAHEVVQNQNSKINHKENEEVKYVDTTKDEQFTNFVNNANDIAEKYEEYVESSTQAKEAVEDAKTEVTALNDAIDTLKENRKGRISNSASRAILDLVVEYGVSEEEFANMSTGQAIALMTNLMKAANDRMDKALLTLADINEKFLAATDTVYTLNAINTSNTVSTAQTNEGQGGTTQQAQATPSDTTAAPVADVAGTAGNEEAQYVEAGTENLDEVADDIVRALVADQGEVLGEDRNYEAGEAAYLPLSTDTIVEVPVDVTNPTLLDNNKLATIDDTEVPLVSEVSLMDAEVVNISWWWLLIIAILGVTGEKMYKEHMKKEEEAVASK